VYVVCCLYSIMRSCVVFILAKGNNAFENANVQVSADAIIEFGRGENEGSAEQT